ncbi:MAG: hypothetical protein KGI71_04740 [Patescibacteria group bacterium]|nr:hypothetical protein [Patescibacteria group bacterium]
MSYAEAIFGGGRQIGAGLVTPGDILAYRAAWDPYVQDTVRVAQMCSQEWAAAAASVPQGSKGQIEAAKLAQLFAGDATKLAADWALWSTVSDSTLVLQGATILEQQQGVVMQAGKERVALTSGVSPCALTYYDQNGQVVAATNVPDPSLQAQIVARIEGLGILASGILQILVSSAGNGIVAAGSAGQWIAKQAAHTGSWLTSPWTWGIAGVLLVGTTAVIVYNADRVAKVAGALRPV